MSINENQKEEIKTTGGGALIGMIFGGSIGIIFGPGGVILGGLIGALIGDELEKRELEEEQRKKQTKPD